MFRKANALTIANLITAVRIIMAVAAAALFSTTGMEKLAVILCVSAAVLDAIDGWCARFFSQCSKLGKLLDPIADKLIITVMYTVIAVRMHSPLIWVLFALMLLREIGITIMRYFAFRKKDILIASSRLGKIKMVAQTFFGGLILVYGYFFMDEFNFPVYPVAGIMILVLALTYFSAYQYITSWGAPLSAKRDTADDAFDECDDKEKRMVVGK
jgi:CDP-diacylglycerol--glycerol-3-phosphate 3-phosphatidyltransferase